jgi:hypothetical protein
MGGLLLVDVAVLRFGWKTVSGKPSQKSFAGTGREQATDIPLIRIARPVSNWQGIRP